MNTLKFEPLNNKVVHLRLHYKEIAQKKNSSKNNVKKKFFKTLHFAYRLILFIYFLTYFYLKTFKYLD